VGFDASPLVMIRRRRARLEASFIEKIGRNDAYHCPRGDL
jgi:hypothetical protein